MYVRKIKLGDDVLLIPDSTEALATKADYEEGLFTPRFWSDSDVEQTFDWVEGYYKKIGNLCYIFISAQASSDVSVVFVDNLPFEPNINIYHTLYEKGLVFANGEGCFVKVPHNHGQINLVSPATSNLFVEGIYNI